MAVSFEVPRWLEPPNEMERARIDEATAAAQQKAGVMIRRQIGMRRMQDETQQAIANGVDPITARQNALLNNAHLVFSDNPQAVSGLLEKAEANQIKDRARLQAMQKQEALNLFNSLKLDHEQQRIDQLVKHQTELEKSSSEAMKAKQRALDLAEERNAAASKAREAEEEGRNLRSQLSQNRLSKEAETKSRIEVEKMLQTDQAYGALVTALNEAKAAAAKTTGWFGRPLSAETKREAQLALQKAEKDVQDYRAKVGKRFNIDMGEESPALKPVGETETALADSEKPTAKQKMPADLREGTIIRQGNSRYRYIGGDTNDPDSWAKIVE